MEYIATEIIGEREGKEQRLGCKLNYPLEEIVRCRDCKHFASDDNYCFKLRMLCRFDNFCAWGERSE